MFISINGGEYEIYRSPLAEGFVAARTVPGLLGKTFKLNLNHVQRIHMDTFTREDLELKPDTEEWSEIVGFKYISFYIPSIVENAADPSNPLDDSFTLYFGENAMGEYNRLRRLIDENTCS